MERRHFLKLAFGFAAGGVALAASAQAAPLTPQPLVPDGQLPANPDAHPAVTTGDEVDRLKPEEVRGGAAAVPRLGPRSWLGPPALGLASSPLGLAPQALGLASRRRWHRAASGAAATGDGAAIDRPEQGLHRAIPGSVRRVTRSPFNLDFNGQIKKPRRSGAFSVTDRCYRTRQRP